ncbi:MAG: penicillin-binding protein 2 [Gammaproteobacteria bacterium]
MRTTIKDHIRESRLFNERAAAALVIALLLVLVIIARLVYLQIINHEHYATLAYENRINIVAIPPTRGLIYDRNGVLLAQNLPSFSLEITPEQVPDMERTIAGLQRLMDISEEEIQRFRRQSKQYRPFNSIPLKFHLNEQEVARFAVNRYRFPGVDIEARLIRDYPLRERAVHSIGYVGRINEEELQELDAANYSATRFIGKTGVEKYYEDILHGRVGYKNVETNALGRVLREVSRTPPVPGEDIYLTIDINLQALAEEALRNRRGAVVAIDPRNGDILALVSMPGYDPNPYVTGIDSKTYHELQTSIDKPLFNRALRGQYPPGSTIKPFIGLAGLDYQLLTIGTTSYCPGWYSLPGDDHKYRDWKKTGHGRTNLDKAIVQSCDVYFYDLALSLGIDHIHDFLAKFGFGEKSGIDLKDEASGLLPSRQWKRANRHEPWYTGETLITGIGQGYLLATPLQLAATTAVIANRGGRVRPHLLYARHAPAHEGLQLSETQPLPPVELAAARHWTQIIASMERVVHSIRGTAHGIGRGAPYRIAGKTGTAQVFGIKQDEKYVKEEITSRLRDHALFIAFAPVEAPRIALAVIVENGGGGGSTAAPIARKLMDYYLNNKDAPHS